jgi:DNA-binding cell septation regulator SpoVG
MKVTKVKITFIKPVAGMVAFAEVVLDEQLFLCGIGIHEKMSGGGYRLTYPIKMSGNKPFQLFHPVHKELSQRIEQAVITQLKTVKSAANAGHRSTDTKQS